MIKPLNKLVVKKLLLLPKIKRQKSYLKKPFPYKAPLVEVRHSTTEPNFLSTNNFNEPFCAKNQPHDIAIKDIIHYDKIEELKKLIKHLTISFKARLAESDFIIKEGVFEGAKFSLKKQSKFLDISIYNASYEAISLLNENKASLSMHLLKKNIHLSAINFF